ncbi:SigB/SigF/SigG family RNA polymerase sigma factor [Streptomyces hundungensis]|uniref:SigB/SigF/SigG family RNA polymerase sigma factor n=1 Tax=Streptomyces hundungensis TaxID=1077946 RepID=UPI0031E58D67
MATVSPHDRADRHDDAPDTSAAFARLSVLGHGAERDTVREDVIAQWLPLSRRLAGKYRNRGADIEDLYQVAAMGLVKAVDRYEEARGAFAPYAIPTITGELKRHFRDSLWSVHVPRRVQELRNKVRIARSELQAGQPGEPSIEDLAARTGLDEGEVQDGLEAIDSFKSLSLEAETAGESNDSAEGMSLADGLGAADPGFDTVIDREAAKPALRALPEREAKILYMRFFEDKTQTQIGAELGISQMHVSRLLAATCTRVRRQTLAEHAHAA